MSGHEAVPLTKASRNRVICADRAVPAGWVVVEVGFNAACDGDGVNALVIKQPGRREVVCACSPLPDGYRRDKAVHSDACPGDGDNAWLIVRDDATSDLSRSPGCKSPRHRVG